MVEAQTFFFYWKVVKNGIGKERTQGGKGSRHKGKKKPRSTAEGGDTGEKPEGEWNDSHNLFIIEKP